jgi:hypothetical protein
MIKRERRQEEEMEVKGGNRDSERRRRQGEETGSEGKVEGMIKENTTKTRGNERT